MDEQITTGLFTIAGVIVGLFFEPAVQKYAKARETKALCRELIRIQMKQFFVDCKAVDHQLNMIAKNEIGRFFLSEEVYPLTAIIENNLGSLKPKQMSTFSLVLDHAHIMVLRRRALNTVGEDIRRKKTEDSNAVITSELQTIKADLIEYLKRSVEQNVLMYQAIVELGVADYVYVDGKKKSHKDVHGFWDKMRREEKPPYDPNELAPYEPHGKEETEWCTG